METWLTPAVRGLLAVVLVVAAQAAAPATVRGLCGVLPVVVQPVQGDVPVVKPSALKSSVLARTMWLAPSSE